MKFLLDGKGILPTFKEKLHLNDSSFKREYSKFLLNNSVQSNLKFDIINNIYFQKQNLSNEYFNEKLISTTRRLILENYFYLYMKHARNVIGAMNDLNVTLEMTNNIYQLTIKYVLYSIINKSINLKNDIEKRIIVINWDIND